MLKVLCRNRLYVSLRLQVKKRKLWYFSVGFYLFASAKWFALYQDGGHSSAVPLYLIKLLTVQELFLQMSWLMKFSIIWIYWLFIHVVMLDQVLKNVIRTFWRLKGDLAICKTDDVTNHVPSTMVDSRTAIINL